VAIDCRNSGTTMRLLAGLSTARPGSVRFDGDASLRRRPMARLAPLAAMGAHFAAGVPGDRARPKASEPESARAGAPADGVDRWQAPFTVTGVARPRGIDVRLSVASAQVKSAILSAGLFGEGRTRIVEPGRSRDHTERWLRWLGTDVRAGPIGPTGGARADRAEAEAWEVVLEPRTAPWAGRVFDVPPDFSSAAFLVAASLLAGDDRVVVRSGTNPTRTGFLAIAARMGADVRATEEAPAGPEPVARLDARRSTGLRAVEIGPDHALSALDELPLLMGLAAFADGRTVLRGAGELRVKESDRLESMGRVLSAFGIRVELGEDGATVHGAQPAPARVESAGDHRIAMTAVVMALAVAGTTVIHDADVIDVSYPGFVDALRALGADVVWDDAQPPEWATRLDP